MPQDFSSIEFKADAKSKAVAMSWYGENLWRTEVDFLGPVTAGQLCAIDYAGNKKCVTVAE